MKKIRISRKNIDRIHFFLVFMTLLLFAGYESNRLHKTAIVSTPASESTIGTTGAIFPVQANHSR